MLTNPITVADSHPSLPGHFPGFPIVPGVVLLNYVFAELQQRWPGVEIIGIQKLKFLRSVFPAVAFNIEFAAPTSTALRFKCWFPQTAASSAELQAGPILEGQVLLRGVVA